MGNEVIDKGRRRILAITTGVGAVGVGFAAAPFVMSMMPSARAKAAGAPVEVDISKIEPGQMLTVEWRGKPVWVLHRTPEMLASLDTLADKIADPNSEASEQPGYVDPKTRGMNPEVIVLVGICTHLGCSPVKKLKPGAGEGMDADWKGGFYCPCHGSRFDLAGRVFKNMPAPTNLPVPPHSISDSGVLIVGVDPKEGVA